MHPEKLPDNSPLSSQFTFSFEVGKEQRREIAKTRAEIEAKIDEVISSVGDNRGLNVIVPLMRMFTDADDILKLSEALNKLVPLLEELDKIRSRDSAFELAEKDPNFFRSAFGDYSSELSSIFPEDTDVTEAVADLPKVETSAPATKKISHLKEL